MSKKERVTVDFDSESYYLDGEFWESWDNYGEEMADKINDLLNEQYEQISEQTIQLDYLKAENSHMRAVLEENKRLKKDVEYWKQVASQYSNELNVFEHSKNHKTKCKDIYWSSD